jgi:hypothetical protein
VISGLRAYGNMALIALALASLYLNKVFEVCGIPG